MSLKSNSTCGLPGVCLGEIRIVLTVLGLWGLYAQAPHLPANLHGKDGATGLSVSREGTHGFTPTKPAQTFTARDSGCCDHNWTQHAR